MEANPISFHIGRDEYRPEIFRHGQEIDRLVDKFQFLEQHIDTAVVHGQQRCHHRPDDDPGQEVRQIRHGLYHPFEEHFAHFIQHERQRIGAGNPKINFKKLMTIVLRMTG